MAMSHYTKRMEREKAHRPPGIVTHTYNPSYLGSRDQEDQRQPGQIVHKSLSQKKKTPKFDTVRGKLPCSPGEVTHPSPQL
jgi:hypothetical protein